MARFWLVINPYSFSIIWEKLETGQLVFNPCSRGKKSEFKDNSKDILNELGVKDDDGFDDCEGDSDCEVESEEDENAIDEILFE